MTSHRPRIYNDDLPGYVEIHKALSDSLNQVLERDYDLISLGGHEQAISHRLAVYLEPAFPEFQTDCEYNRCKHKSKRRHPETPGDNTQMRPDIIVHRRNSAMNVLAVEMKANANGASATDLKKLKCLKAENNYLYKVTAFICIRNSLQEMKDGVLTAYIQWYDVEQSDNATGKDEIEEVACRTRIEEVKSIIAQRTERERRPSSSGRS